ncbi:XdhC family protein (plasmid) [Rhizobium leguminosarum]|uniref:XdhC family protein n=1 Tax=Rhizobium leguminosarum TaxID=384 RepID=UPI00036F98CF|nr:XdhC family protein [Rhizobium leguminosarum]MDH6661963.1 xanthine dehydrogenase accessory factor [Rhizobium sophorae]MBB4524856.1 xanthine dehydrogenase accessory factor [Rhizobium leguminosarum]MBP2490810.1 xanthine dehydrogenase accessory factor [Rhizobium leguminosarum]MDV4166340.1 XdhC family protein [Rhizobium leguminosarum]MDV4176778.1 XdhC family protein [Rhizobium leguminosarum]
MNNFSSLLALPTPARAHATDDPVEVLRFAVEAFAQGSVAIATLVEIRGGAARSLGSHVVVSADGRYCGYVSGGCVEAAVAAEALLALEERCDRTVMFGEGSPFIDIVLPCGGGITVAIHLLRKITAIEHVLDTLKQRRPAALRYSFVTQSLEPAEPVTRAGWQNGSFVTVYRPTTRVVLSGQTVEAQTVARVAEVAGYDVVVWHPREVALSGSQIIDPFTAVILLHHDLDQEAATLHVALRSGAFYIGALGSTRTHKRREDQLIKSGFSEIDLSRIKAPIGVFGPTRDASSLALSVLADVAATRLMVYA